MRTRRLRAALLASLLVCAMGAPPARASTASEAGWHIGSALSTAVYAPLKLFYAAAGLVFGGIGWGISGGDPGVMDAVVTPAVRGDYLVTPAHLRGERRLEFVGTAPPHGEPGRGLTDQGEPASFSDADYGY